MSDEERLNWLERIAWKSQTGFSFDWIPSVDGEPAGFRFMRKDSIGSPHRDIRRAIDAASGEVNAMTDIPEQESADDRWNEVPEFFTIPNSRTGTIIAKRSIAQTYNDTVRNGKPGAIVTLLSGGLISLEGVEFKEEGGALYWRKSV